MEPDSTLPPEIDPHQSLSTLRIREAVAALDADDAPALRQLIASLRLEDRAELMNHLSGSRTEQLVALLGEDFDADVLPLLDGDTAERVLAGMDNERTAEVFAEMELDDALHVLEHLEKDEQQELLATIDPATRKELMAGLSYPEASAGRLMRHSMVFVPEFWSVGDAIDYMRRHSNLPEEFYVVYVVNPSFKPVGLLPLARIMQNRRELMLRDLMTVDLHCFKAATDQEEVAHAFRKYGLVEAPVVGEDGRLMGTITVDDVVDVMREETEEDFMRLAGTSAEELEGGLLTSVKTRFFWLFINLVTAIAASAVISGFQGTIEKVVTLAVLMPIIASMGGNAGIQASTVTVRSIATRRLHASRMRVIGREILIGTMTGIGIGGIMAVGILFYYHDWVMAVIFCVACVGNMMVAGLAGAGLPMLMHKLKIDPAITSGVFLTMFTDICGFFAFLGLATLVLLHHHG